MMPGTQGVPADWNILYGFPGETKADYDKMLALLKEIRFLDAPTACGPVRLDRFSPYFLTPEQFGIHDLRPNAPYKYLYPFVGDTLRRIAYYFDYDYDPSLDHSDFAGDVTTFSHEWQLCPVKESLRVVRNPEGVLTPTWTPAPTPSDSTRSCGESTATSMDIVIRCAPCNLYAGI